MNMDAEDNGAGKAPTRWQLSRSAFNIIFSVPITVFGLYLVCLPFYRLFTGEVSVGPVVVWIALIGVILTYGGYRCVAYEVRALGSNSEPTACAEPPPGAESVPEHFRRNRWLLSAGTLGCAFLLLWSCQLFGCRYPSASSDATSLFRASVIGGCVLAVLFAVQALSGLSLRGLGRAWRKASSVSQALIAIILIAAFLFLASVLDSAFERIGIDAPTKRHLPPHMRKPPPPKPLPPRPAVERSGWRGI